MECGANTKQALLLQDSFRDVKLIIWRRFHLSLVKIPNALYALYFSGLEIHRDSSKTTVEI
ncbi:hypothetical protein T11_4544, partial [Trichinella zimbabwensis]